MKLCSSVRVSACVKHSILRQSEISVQLRRLVMSETECCERRQISKFKTSVKKYA